MNKQTWKTKLICLSSLLLLLTGCIPGPPPPPIFPGLEWLGIAVVVVIAILLWKQRPSDSPAKTAYLTETLNTISRQLRELEKKIDELEKKRDDKNNN